jgi:hypothetical protein
MISKPEFIIIRAEQDMYVTTATRRILFYIDFWISILDKLNLEDKVMENHSYQIPEDNLSKEEIEDVEFKTLTHKRLREILVAECGPEMMSLCAEVPIMTVLGYSGAIYRSNRNTSLSKVKKILPKIYNLKMSRLG